MNNKSEKFEATCYSRKIQTFSKILFYLIFNIHDSIYGTQYSLQIKGINTLKTKTQFFATFPHSFNMVQLSISL